MFEENPEKSIKNPKNGKILKKKIIINICKNYENNC